MKKKPIRFGYEECVYEDPKWGPIQMTWYWEQVSSCGGAVQVGIPDGGTRAGWYRWRPHSVQLPMFMPEEEADRIMEELKRKSARGLIHPPTLPPSGATGGPLPFD